MSETAIQQTLTGEPTDEPRERPDTFMWCQETQTSKVPDDFNPYGRTPLWEVYGNADD